MNGAVIPLVAGSQKIDIGTGSLGKSTKRDYADYNIIDISQNPEKSPGDLG